VHIFCHLLVCFQTSVYTLGEAYTKPNNVLSLHFKLEVYDVTLFMCQSRSTIFPGILIFVIFLPRDMTEYIFMFRIALECIFIGYREQSNLQLTGLKECYIPTPNALV
jgi:hypothetical protein